MKAIIFDFNRTLFDPEKNELDENTVVVLNSLSKKFFLALICKGGEDRKHLVESLGISKYFKVIEFCVEKNLEIFKKIFEKLSIEPTDAIVVGDRVKKEIMFGNLVGAKTAWLQKGKFASELPENENEKPDYTISNLKELLEIAK